MKKEPWAARDENQVFSGLGIRIRVGSELPAGLKPTTEEGNPSRLAVARQVLGNRRNCIYKNQIMNYYLMELIVHLS
jgi:hypothetical protein